MNEYKSKEKVKTAENCCKADFENVKSINSTATGNEGMCAGQCDDCLSNGADYQNWFRFELEFFCACFLTFRLPQ